MGIKFTAVLIYFDKDGKEVRYEYGQLETDENLFRVLALPNQCPPYDELSWLYCYSMTKTFPDGRPELLLPRKIYRPKSRTLELQFSKRDL